MTEQQNFDPLTDPEVPQDENDDQPEQAPEPVEPEVVTVEPAETPTGKTDNVLGVDYTVDPERGYRRS